MNDEIMEKEKPYPIFVNVKDITNAQLWGEYHRRAHLGVYDKEGRFYRILQPTLLLMLNGALQEVPVVFKYNCFYLDVKLTKNAKEKRKLRKTESQCMTCNGHGRIDPYSECKECNGRGKLNWVQTVFKNDKKG